MNMPTKLLAVALTAALGACASTPSGPPAEVVRLQSELDRLQSDPAVAGFASAELVRAEDKVQALVANGRRTDSEWFHHNVYLADRLLQTAEAAGRARFAENRATELGAERDRLLAQAKSRDLDVARQLAAQAAADADNARADASDARLSAEMSRAEAEASRADLQAARDEMQLMRSHLVELQTAETERGLVVTLGDVLFEVDRAELKPGASRKLDALVAALREDPNASIEIEGHTDSTGGRAYNVDLSQRRADSVRNYLVSHGIATSRIVARGMGPDYPVATNGTESGRQQNRRVEVIVQNEVDLVGMDR